MESLETLQIHFGNSLVRNDKRYNIQNTDILISVNKKSYSLISKSKLYRVPSLKNIILILKEMLRIEYKDINNYLVSIPYNFINYIELSSCDIDFNIVQYDIDLSTSNALCKFIKKI